MPQKDSRDDSEGPASTQKFNYLYLHFERGNSQYKNIPTNKPLKPSCRAFEILQQNNFERMIRFMIDSLSILEPFLRTAEHTFGIRCLTSLFRILMRSLRGIPFNCDHVIRRGLTGPSKFTRRTRGHFVTLIEIGMHVIGCMYVYIYIYLGYSAVNCY